MKRRYLGQSSQPYPISALTVSLGSGKEVFVSARAQHEGSGSFDTRAGPIRQEGLT